MGSSAMTNPGAVETVERAPFVRFIDVPKGETTSKDMVNCCIRGRKVQGQGSHVDATLQYGRLPAGPLGCCRSPPKTTRQMNQMHKMAPVQVQVQEPRPNAPAKCLYNEEDAFQDKVKQIPDDVQMQESCECVGTTDAAENPPIVFKEGYMPDVIVVVQDVIFKTHSFVLCRHSKYFRDLLVYDVKQEMPELRLDDVTPESFRILLRCYYGVRVKITKDNVCDLRLAANFLHNREIVKYCDQYIKSVLTENSVLRSYEKARSVGLEELTAKIRRFIGKEFKTLSNGIDFLCLSQPILCEILSDDGIQVSTELEVFDAALRWLDYDSESRRHFAATVLQNVRFHLMKTEDLMESLARAPILMENPRLRNIIFGANWYKTCQLANEPTKAAFLPALPGERLKPRQERHISKIAVEGVQQATIPAKPTKAKKVIRTEQSLSSVSDGPSEASSDVSFDFNKQKHSSKVIVRKPSSRRSLTSAQSIQSKSRHVAQYEDTSPVESIEDEKDVGSEKVSKLRVARVRSDDENEENMRTRKRNKRSTATEKNGRKKSHHHYHYKNGKKSRKSSEIEMEEELDRQKSRSSRKHYKTLSPTESEVSSSGYQDTSNIERKRSSKEKMQKPKEGDLSGEHNIEFNQGDHRRSLETHGDQRPTKYEMIPVQMAGSGKDVNYRETKDQVHGMKGQPEENAELEFRSGSSGSANKANHQQDSSSSSKKKNGTPKSETNFERKRSSNLLRKLSLVGRKKSDTTTSSRTSVLVDAASQTECGDIKTEKPKSVGDILQKPKSAGDILEKPKSDFDQFEKVRNEVSEIEQRKNEISNEDIAQMLIDVTNSEGERQQSKESIMEKRKSDKIRNNSSNSRKSLVKKGIHLVNGHTSIAVALLGGADPEDSQTKDAGRQFWSYDTEANEWIREKDIPEGVLHHAAVLLSSSIYVIGGAKGIQKAEANLIKNSYRYDLNKKIWVKLPKMMTPRMYHACVALNGVIYAIGGQDGKKKVLKSVEVFNPATNKWTIVAPLNQARRLFGAAVYNNQIFVVGGIEEGPSGSLPLSADVEAYDPVINKWIKKKPLVDGRAGLCLNAVDGRLFMTGGFSRSLEPEKHVEHLSTIEVYDIKSETWTEVTRMKSERRRCVIACADSRLLIFGGTDEKSVQTSLGDVLCYDTTTDNWIEDLSAHPRPALGMQPLVYKMPKT